MLITSRDNPNTFDQSAPVTLRFDSAQAIFCHLRDLNNPSLGDLVLELFEALQKQVAVQNERVAEKDPGPYVPGPKTKAFLEAKDMIAAYPKYSKEEVVAKMVEAGENIHSAEQTVDILFQQFKRNNDLSKIN